MAIEYNKVFVDTALFIYYLEKNPFYFDSAKSFFEDCIKERKTILTSVITVQEYLVYPYMQNDKELIKNFNEFLNACDIHIIDITRSVAEKAAEIRAELRSVKGMDALQLAAAFTSGCDAFFTNDIRLCRYDKLSCVTLDIWKQIHKA